MSESASFQAITLTRKIFEHIHGNLGILRFNVDELVPTNGSEDTESKKWDIVCSFFETLGSSSPSKYKASVNLDNNTVVIKKLSGPTMKAKKIEGSWVVKQKRKEEQSSGK
ncbi:hypothetical protein KKA18_03370 [Patescibacteria group bacterium]|nr:hypothetical protein [Patescibacteria group bacterium]